MKSFKKLILIGIFLSPIITTGQNRIKGKITDGQTGDPVYNASVKIKGTTHIVHTNFLGIFDFKSNTKLPLTLVIQSVEYKTKEFIVTDTTELIIALEQQNYSLSEVKVTARRRDEELQQIPIPVAVLTSAQIDNSLSFNVNRIKEMVPSVQLYSSNPRNTTLNIRGLGSTFGLTNDGIDPGVGFYVDGVYYARAAATSLDFIDVQQIEVIRGPQGTLFGKNTTAGTFNITTRKPTFVNTATYEQSLGNYGFIQGKGSFSGPLIENKLAIRVSFSGTHREGFLTNVNDNSDVNTLSNQGAKLQFLYNAGKKLSFLLSGDYTRQRPNGYAQVFAGVVQTQNPAYRQFETIIADLNYQLPSRNPFDRLIDHDTPWKSSQDMGGASLNANYQLSKGQFTSTTAWRSWLWQPSNDRDFTGLQILSKSEAPSIHHQYSQEFRYTSELGKRINLVAGLFGFYQTLDPKGAHTLESGKDQWRFSQSTTSSLWATPGLFDGYGLRSYPVFRNLSAAFYGQVDIKLTEKLILNPGIRINYDQKSVDFRSETYGGLQTTNTALIALQKRVYSAQSFKADVEKINYSGQLTINYKFLERIRAYGNYSLAFKPVGLNLGGLPTQNGQPLTELAVVKPEEVYHAEIGIKSEPFKKTILNLSVFNTDIKNYQTNVRTAELAVVRGYLANAEKVNVKGLELEFSFRAEKYFRINSSVSYTDGRYVSFKNAPVPLEETGPIQIKDISGGVLPGISKWAVSGGIELFRQGKLIGQEGEFFIAGDTYYRSSFSSNPSPSQYLNIEGYQLVNARLGFRAPKGITVFVWSRNLLNTNYFEELLPAGGNAGHYAGVLGDPRTYGITFRYNIF